MLWFVAGATTGFLRFSYSYISLWDGGRFSRIKQTNKTNNTRTHRAATPGSISPYSNTHHSTLPTSKWRRAELRCRICQCAAVWRSSALLHCYICQYVALQHHPPGTYPNRSQPHTPTILNHSNHTLTYRSVLHRIQEYTQLY